MPRYDFECSHCHVTFEAITPTTVTSLPCTSCQPTQYIYPENYDGPAKRKLSAPAQIHIH